MDSKYLSFAHEHHNLDWSRVLCSKFGRFQSINIWVLITQSGPFSVSFSEGIFYEMQYVKVLTDTLIPYIARNQNTIFLQESNDITTSEIVRSWFKEHPLIHCITWPSNYEVAFPISPPWTDMKMRLDGYIPLCSLQAKSIIIGFWKNLKPEFFVKSFIAAKDGLRKSEDEHLTFARDHSGLDWKKVLFSKYGTVRCVSVWTAGTHLGALNVSTSNGLPSVAGYIKILNEIVRPYLIRNRDAVYIQESNEITKSDVVSSWFRMRPDVKCLLWPPISSPMSTVWDAINEHVDNNFPLTSDEINQLVLEFWEKLKKETPNYFPNSFVRTKQCLLNVNK